MFWNQFLQFFGFGNVFFFAQPLQNFPRSTPRWEEASGRRKKHKKTDIFYTSFWKEITKPTQQPNFVWQNEKLWQKTCDLIRQIDKNSVKRSICHKISVCERCDGSKKKTLKRHTKHTGHTNYINYINHQLPIQSRSTNQSTSVSNYRALQLRFGSDRT